MKNIKIKYYKTASWALLKQVFTYILYDNDNTLAMNNANLPDDAY